MKRVIVSGANGFVGSALVRELIDNGVEVVALDRAGCNENLPKDEKVRFVEHELDRSLELPEIIGDRGFDAFYHFAWVGSAGPARADATLQLNNAVRTIDCLRAAKELGCRRFVCAGSIMEQETIAATFAQENRPGLGYIYGSGKLAAHTMCMSVAADIGIDLIWTEITNAYGTGELSPRFVNTTLRKIMNNEPLQFTAATQNYDFVYITDVARAFRLIGEKGRAFCHYLIGSSNAAPLKNFILQIRETLAPDREFLFGDIPFTGIDLPLEKFDCSRTEADTGFRAEISFGEGVRRTLAWLKTQED